MMTGQQHHQVVSNADRWRLFMQKIVISNLALMKTKTLLNVHIRSMLKYTFYRFTLIIIILDMKYMQNCNSKTQFKKTNVKMTCYYVCIAFHYVYDKIEYLFTYTRPMLLASVQQNTYMYYSYYLFHYLKILNTRMSRTMELI